MNLVESFWSKVDRSGSCWVWTAGLRDGYGRFRNVGAHRFSYELAFGPIPDGLFVCHKCDNRRCVRPEHLFAGTHSDNMRDMYAKGRSVPPLVARPELRRHGELNAAAKLTDEAVRIIRESYNGGETQASLAERFGVDRTTIGLIVRGSRWSLAGGPTFDSSTSRARQAAKVRALTDDEIREALDLRASGMTMVSIAEKLSVSRSTIARVVFGKLAPLGSSAANQSRRKCA